MEEWPMVMILLRKNPEGMPLTRVVDALYPDCPYAQRRRVYGRIRNRCDTAARNGKLERIDMVYGLGYRVVR